MMNNEQSLRADAPWRLDLRQYVHEIKSRYNPVPFHSYEHATHVTLSANRLMAGLVDSLGDFEEVDVDSNNGDGVGCRKCCQDKDANCEKGCSTVSGNYQQEEAITPLERIALVFTALIHDVSHVGISNAQMEEMEDHPICSPICRAYSDPENLRSYSECQSLDVGLELLLGNDENYGDLRAVLFCIGGSGGDDANTAADGRGSLCKSGMNLTVKGLSQDGNMSTFSALAEHLVMCTDIASAERRKLGMERWEQSFGGSNDKEKIVCEEVSQDQPLHDKLKPFSNRLKQWTVLEQLIQLSDVAHLTQSWETFLKWNSRLYVELIEAYRLRLRGLVDKKRKIGPSNIPPHPSEGWYQNQIGFFDFYVIPLTERVQHSGALVDGMGQSIVDNAKNNRDRWVNEGRSATEMMVSSASSVAGGSIAASLLLDEEDEKRNAESVEELHKVNFGDPDDDIRASIERLRCHLPLCVSQYLEEEGSTALLELESQMSERTRKKSADDQCTVATEGSKWSWRPTSITQPMSRSMVLSRSSMGSSTSSLDGSSNRLSLGDSTPRTNAITTPRFALPLPAQPYYQAALLLVDISGFTSLSTELDVESLSHVINSYFEELCEEVKRFGGDVLKFAGDAFFCAWMIPDDDTQGRAGAKERLRRACLSAALCGAAIVSKYSLYSIADLHVKGSANLSVHCGLGLGKVRIVHVGDNTRREFLFLGDPVKQVAAAIEHAGLGELAASSCAIKCLETASKDQFCLDFSLAARDKGLQDNNRVFVIARRSERFFCLPQEVERAHMDGMILPPSDHVSFLSACPHKADDILREHMELYVHPSARQDCSKGRKQLSGRNRVLASAELRRVFTMFVKPDIDPTLTFNEEKDTEMFTLLNNVFNITQQILKRYKGHLRQYIIDDKGVVLILSWGQRGATYPNLVAEKGLPAAIALRDALQFELNIDCRVGATYGQAYCGVVGSIKRHEFAVLGSSVNLAARLACSDTNDGILVDDAIRKAADDSFDFFTLEPVYAKGYDKPVPIFEPQAAIERRWKSADHFVGREKELKMLVRVVQQQLFLKGGREVASGAKPNLIFIQAHSGLGKSSFAMQAVDKVRKLGTSLRTDITVVRNICCDGEELVPLSVFRKIVLDLIIQKDSSNHDADDEVSALTFDEASMMGGNGSDTLQLQRLLSLCAEMKYSEGIAVWLGYHLFNLCPSMEHELLVNNDSKISPEDAVAFIADAFLTCISSFDFVLLGIDDAQYMDELSWQVLDQLLSRGGDNLIAIVTSRPVESTSQIQNIKPILKELREDKRLTEIELQPFLQEDVKELLAKSVGCNADLIEDHLLQVVFEQSGGMPFFCSEVIKDIIEQDLILMRSDGSVGWRDSKAVVQKGVHSNMTEFLLHRLDRLSPIGRDLLQLCSVLGLEFSLSELLMVRFQRGWPNKTEVENILEVLSAADKDAILNQTCQTGTIKLRRKSTHIVTLKDKQNWQRTNGIAERTFMFPHSMWRECLYSTMLKERRQNLHLSVATAMEEEYLQQDDKIDHMNLKQYLKIFLHWKESGNNLVKATNLAKRIGKHLASLQLHQQSLDVCMEAMKAWTEEGDDQNEIKKYIGVIPLSVILKIGTDELVCLAQLHIAIARNPLLYCGGNYDSSYYINCEKILQQAPAAELLKDRSVFFTLYSGLFLLYKNKYIEDEDGSAQERLATGFVEQATLHGDPIHIARALAMFGLTLGLAGKYEEALAVQKKLEKVYSPDLTEGICREYTSDRAAQNYGYSVLWYDNLDRHDEADRQIEYIVRHLMPRMKPQDVHNAFLIIFPVVWVLLDRGECSRAETLFVEYVYDNYDKFYGDRSSSSTYYYYLYKPLRFLLRLARNEEMPCADAQYDDIESWIFSEDFLDIQRYLASYMCALGKDSNCILAEICCLLASNNSGPSSEEHREKIIRKGLHHARLSMQDTEGQRGYDYARRQILKVNERLSILEKQVL